MNNLSWLIYAAGAVENLTAIVYVSIAIFALSAAIMAIPACIGKFDRDMGDGSFFDKVWSPMVRRGAPIAALMLVISAALPSRNTLMMIAASEFGERVATSKQVTDIANPAAELLKSWIKNEMDKIQKRASS